ncbi:DUF3237 domain-containing protein [Ramlibacter sp.]|uniref:DUF3237 domain-containing protein n=1 Tax=Ramlibacter sp. TaxID=1917967 RepID=UPI0035B16FC0
MTPITLQPLFSIKAIVTAPPQLVGAVPHGFTRRVMVVSGGHFEGERLSGQVLPGGADVVLERPDGGLHLDVRLMLQTTQGELIYMTYQGRRNGPTPEIMRQIVNREPIPRGADYFRVLVQFETAAPRLAWLNDKVAIGTGTRESDGPVYDVWEVA